MADEWALVWPFSYLRFVESVRIVAVNKHEGG